MKKITALALALIMIFALGTNNVALAESKLNNQTSISNYSAETIYEKIKNNILFKYGDIYTFDNFSYEFLNERIEGENSLIDVNIFTDMTLIQHPLDSAFIKELHEELSLIENENEKYLIQEEINKYIDEIETLYYNKPDKCVFTYTIKLNNSQLLMETSADNNNYQLFYRMDITPDEVIMEPVMELRKVNENTDIIKNNAKNALSDIQSSITQYTVEADFVYDRLAARDYALLHATDEPEFSSANGQGSDCANFVSKSLNAGNIPVDNSGNWFPSTDGTTATCGTNWMRTGYYNNGGVVPYMTGKGYFYEQATESQVYAGSIMSWDNTSHVALVTYGDSVTIKYTQHSSVKLSSTSAKNVVYETEVATFYMPSTTIQ